MVSLLSIAFPFVALLAGGLVFWDSVRRGTTKEMSAIFAFIVAGLFLAGSLPGLVALAVSSDRATQGFPTSLRLIPGIAATVLYVYFRHVGVSGRESLHTDT